MSALAVSKLHAGYGPMEVLHGVDIELQAGERVGLVGLNGHGKTTLMRSIVGLVGWKRGEISALGQDISGRKTHGLARLGVVMMPQGDALFPGLTVRENLDAGSLASGWRTRAQARDRVVASFPRLGERMGQLAGTLSGGERRMLSIGRGLMSDASVYLVDEPSLGLAPGIATSLVASLLALDLGGGAMLVAEQNRTLIEGSLDRIVQLHAGEVVDGDVVNESGPSSSSGLEV